MVSRKKSKGKDRKAKKIEVERAMVHERWWLYIAREKKMGMTVAFTPSKESVLCNLESVVPNDLDHPVSRFMDEFMTLDNLSLENLEYACQSNPGKIVLNNESYKEIVTQIMIRIGINMLFLDDKTETCAALIMAKSICVLENYTGLVDSYDTIVRSREVATKIRDLHIRSSSGRRDGLKFFSKRVSGVYLKKKHQEARRTQPKMGLCYGCTKEMNRLVLSVCSRCMITQYCSKECQVANWPRHKVECDEFLKIHKQQTQSDDEDDETETGSE